MPLEEEILFLKVALPLAKYMSHGSARNRTWMNMHQVRTSKVGGGGRRMVHLASPYDHVTVCLKGPGASASLRPQL